MGIPCSNSVPERYGPGSGTVPARPCQKAVGDASKTKAGNGIGAVPSARNIKHPTEPSRHPARRSRGGHPREPAGSTQRGVTAAPQRLSARNQHLCQERRRAATHSGHASIATQLHPSTLDHRRGTGCAIGYHSGPFAPWSDPNDAKGCMMPKRQ